MKTALVTGAGSGIGRSICLLLESKGFKVFAVGRRLEKLEETQNMAKHPKQIQPIQADVTVAEDRAKVLKEVGPHGLQYLIHNAGVVGPLKPADQIALEDFQHVMRTNVEAPIFLTQALLPVLTKTYEDTGNKPRILHVSSGCAHSPSPSWLTYCVSKAAFLMAYKCLAVDLEPKGVLVGSFKPGIVETEMQQEMRKATAEDFPKADFFKKLHQEHLAAGETDKSKPQAPSHDRLDTPDNVAHFAWFLLNDTKDEEYPTQDWDIRDKEIANRWIK